MGERRRRANAKDDIFDAPVAPNEALVAVRDLGPPDACEADHAGDDDDLDPAVCPICSGPVRICGGLQACTTGALRQGDRPWITAIRLVYVGVALTSTPASLWGGAMLLLARRIAPRRAPEPRIAALALEHADPGGEETGRCTALALQFLGHEAPARVSPPETRGTRLSADGAARELYLLLHPQTAAPWLREMVTAAQAAARATPLDARTRFPLFRVLCGACGRDDRAPFEHVGTFDEAIRCPGCLMIHRHPIRAVTLGAPHPVGRCLPDPADPQRCMVHERHEVWEGTQGLFGEVDVPVRAERVRGGSLDAEGLCPEGRATMSRAEAMVAEVGEPITPAERALFEAVARAKDVMPAPIVAAVAAIDPEAARALERLPGMGTIGEIAEGFLRELGTTMQGMFGSPGESGAPKTKALPTPQRKRTRARTRGGAQRPGS